MFQSLPRALCALSLIALGAEAQASHVLSLHYGPYVHHWRPDPRHNNTPDLIGLEVQNTRQWLAGAMWFHNSYHQPSQYLYVGRHWSSDALPSLYAKLSAGPLLGYKGEFEDKIPINKDGVGVGVIPAIGYRHDRFSAQVAILGTAGYLITFGGDLLSW